MKHLLFIAFIFLFGLGNAQDVKITAGFGDAELKLNQAYSLNSNSSADSLEFSSVKFFLSLVADVNEYVLFDAHRSSISTVQMNELRSVYLGIDSTTNVSGALGGVLDPSLGMYWSWQSGYINAKLEGVFWKDGLRSEFQFHLGGYANPFNSFREIKLVERFSTVILDLAVFSEMADFSIPKVMRPSELGNNLSDCLSLSFRSE
ncbi:MAG: hypothetical protein GC193_13535 [Cryomorphaceae bacterium]|nr:hypothetical protein [Cryomorphaceae bacterium]